MNVKLAIPIWNGRISPVMDTAGRLLIAEIVDGAEVSRTIVDLPQTAPAHRAKFISDLGVDTMICGALSQQLSQTLMALELKTIAWFRGDVNEVIAAFLSGDLRYHEFLMPGCGRRRGLGMGRRCRRRAGSGQANWRKEK